MKIDIYTGLVYIYKQLPKSEELRERAIKDIGTYGYKSQSVDWTREQIDEYFKITGITGYKGRHAYKIELKYYYEYESKKFILPEIQIPPEQEFMLV